MKQLIFPLFLAILLFSCSKDDINPNDKSANEVQIELQESAPELEVSEWVACCPGERCLNGEINGSGLVVEFSQTTMSSFQAQDMMVFIRPAGSTGNYFFIAQSVTSTYPCVFDFNMYISPGCYEVVFKVSNGQPGQGTSASGNFDPDLTFCCGTGG